MGNLSLGVKEEGDSGPLEGPGDAYGFRYVWVNSVHRTPWWILWRILFDRKPYMHPKCRIIVTQKIYPNQLFLGEYSPGYVNLDTTSSQLTSWFPPNVTFSVQQSNTTILYLLFHLQFLPPFAPLLVNFFQIVVRSPLPCPKHSYPPLYPLLIPSDYDHRSRSKGSTRPSSQGCDWI